MSALEDFGNSVAAATVNYHNDSKDKEIDPMLLALLASIAIQVVKFLIEHPPCDWLKKPETGFGIAQNPGLLQKWLLKHAIKEIMDDREIYKEYGNPMFKAFLDRGKKLTKESFQQVVQAI